MHGKVLLQPPLSEISRVVSQVMFVADAAISLFSKDEKWAGKIGGYFCLADGCSGFPLLITPIGSNPIEKIANRIIICQEKAMRLAQHPAHFSSWESRDRSKDKWGGAVRLLEADLIFSLTGFPELGDEAIMCGATATHNSSVSNPNSLVILNEIAQRSNNPYWKPLSQSIGLRK